MCGPNHVLMRECSNTQSITYYKNISVSCTNTLVIRSDVKYVLVVLFANQAPYIYVRGMWIKKTICRYSFIRKFGFFLESVIGNNSLRIIIIIIVIDVFDFCRFV